MSSFGQSEHNVDPLISSIQSLSNFLPASFDNISEFLKNLHQFSNSLKTTCNALRLRPTLDNPETISALITFILDYNQTLANVTKIVAADNGLVMTLLDHFPSLLELFMSLFTSDTGKSKIQTDQLFPSSSSGFRPIPPIVRIVELMGDHFTHRSVHSYYESCQNSEVGVASHYSSKAISLKEQFMEAMYLYSYGIYCLSSSREIGTESIMEHDLKLTLQKKQQEVIALYLWSQYESCIEPRLNQLSRDRENLQNVLKLFEFLIDTLQERWSQQSNQLFNILSSFVTERMTTLEVLLSNEDRIRLSNRLATSGQQPIQGENSHGLQTISWIDLESIHTTLQQGRRSLLGTNNSEHGSGCMQRMYRQWSTIVSQLVISMLEKIVGLVGPAPTGSTWAVLALGSLARGEACPYSDIELCFLYDCPEYSPQSPVPYLTLIGRILEFIIIGGLRETESPFVSFADVPLTLLPCGLHFDKNFNPSRNPDHMILSIKQAEERYGCHWFHDHRGQLLSDWQPRLPFDQVMMNLFSFAQLLYDPSIHVNPDILVIEQNNSGVGSSSSNRTDGNNSSRWSSRRNSGSLGSVGSGRALFETFQHILVMYRKPQWASSSSVSNSRRSMSVTTSNSSVIGGVSSVGPGVISLDTLGEGGVRLAEVSHGIGAWVISSNIQWRQVVKDCTIEFIRSTIHYDIKRYIKFLSTLLSQFCLRAGILEASNDSRIEILMTTMLSSSDEHGNDEAHPNGDNIHHPEHNPSQLTPALGRVLLDLIHQMTNLRCKIHLFYGHEREDFLLEQSDESVSQFGPVYVLSEYDRQWFERYSSKIEPLLLRLTIALYDEQIDHIDHHHHQPLDSHPLASLLSIGGKRSSVIVSTQASVHESSFESLSFVDLSTIAEYWILKSQDELSMSRGNTDGSLSCDDHVVKSNVYLEYALATSLEVPKQV